MINKLKKGFLLKRRLFLQVTLGAGMLGKSVLSTASTGKTNCYVSPIRAVYHDMPYVDFNGHGGYRPPKVNAATRKALKSLSLKDRQILQHWY